MPGITLSIAFGGGYTIPDRYWVCAPQAYINRPNVYNYYASNTRVINIIHNTTIINNTYVNGSNRYIAGPRAADIQRVTHQRPVVYNIASSNRPGQFDDYCRLLDKYKLQYAEVSDGSGTLPTLADWYSRAIPVSRLKTSICRLHRHYYSRSLASMNPITCWCGRLITKRWRSS